VNRKNLKEWEFEKGITIKKCNRTIKYTEKQYRKLINSKEVVIKTDKGLEYLQEIK